MLRQDDARAAVGGWRCGEDGGERPEETDSQDEKSTRQEQAIRPVPALERFGQ
jgi:hypothetical protein